MVLARHLEERLEKTREVRRAEGRTEGRAEGRAQGRAQGCAEMQTQWEAWNVRRMEAESKGLPFTEPPPSVPAE